MSQTYFCSIIKKIECTQIFTCVSNDMKIAVQKNNLGGQTKNTKLRIVIRNIFGIMILDRQLWCSKLKKKRKFLKNFLKYVFWNTFYRWVSAWV